MAEKINKVSKIAEEKKVAKLETKVQKDFDKKAGELYKVSKETFKQKISNLNKKYKNIKINLAKERDEKIHNAKSQKEILIIKRKHKKTLLKARYKYTLLINAFRNQELYRRGVLESEIDKVRKKYSEKKSTSSQFDKVQEKEKLQNKITKLKKKYSRPVSTHYRKDRVSAFVNKTDIKNLKVPSSNPGLRYVKIVAIIILASILTTIALDVFYKPFGLYNAGLRGITQIFYYIIQNFHKGAPMWYAHALFFGANLPLFFWAWFKIGKKFTMYTFIFIITQYLTSLLFDSVGLYDHIKALGLTPHDIINYRTDHDWKNFANADLYKYAVIFVSAIIASIFYGIGVGLIYKAGGSTGGSKFIITFISAKKNKSVGYFATIFGIVVIFMGLTVNGLIVDKKSFLGAYASPTLLASLVFVFLSNKFLDLTFNKSKKVKLQLFTEKKEDFLYFLDYYLMYDRSFTVDSIKKGHRNKKSYKFELVAHPSDVNKLKDYFLTIDSHAYILESEIKKVSGRFYNSWFE